MSELYEFYTDNFGWEEIETKAGKKYIITGYISTKDMDIYKDIVTEECLKDMLKQIKTKNIKLDVEHEVFRDNPNIIPAGRIIEAKVDEKGIWVKAELNEFSPKFNNVWGSIKSKFIDAFSIAFKPIKAVTQSIQNGSARLLQQVELLNVALTGNPVNPECRIGSVMTKSLNEFKGDKMTEEENTNVPEPVAEEPEPKPEPEPVAETKAEETEEEKKKRLEEEEKKKEEAETKAEYEAELKALNEKVESLGAELKTLKEAPIFKSKVEEKPIETKAKVEWKGPLDLVR